MQVFFLSLLTQFIPHSYYSVKTIITGFYVLINEIINHNFIVNSDFHTYLAEMALK